MTVASVGSTSNGWTTECWLAERRRPLTALDRTNRSAGIDLEMLPRSLATITSSYYTGGLPQSLWLLRVGVRIDGIWFRRSSCASEGGAVRASPCGRSSAAARRNAAG